MNIYKINLREQREEHWYENKPLLVVASDYANAQDKALSFTGRHKNDLLSIELYGELTSNKDVFKLKNR